MEDAPTPAELTERIAAFLADHPAAALLEDGKLLFDLRTARYSVTAEHGRCVLHLWSEERNLVRRVVGTTERKGALRLSVLRMGQTRPQTLELAPDRDRRQPSERGATRTKYLHLLERVLARHFPEWKIDGLRTAMDLERSFGPAYARGLLVRGSVAWAVLAVNAEEPQAIIDGSLTLGVLWLHHCRERHAGRRVVEGLRLILPAGTTETTATRLAWMHPKAAKWELYGLDERSEELCLRDHRDQGNLQTHLVHAPNADTARERFASAIGRVQAMLPPSFAGRMEVVVRNGGEVDFLWHGLEFARTRTELAANSFARVEETTFGTGASETPLTEETAPALRELLQQLVDRRRADGDKRDALYRLQSERWLESVLRQSLDSIDAQIEMQPVYAQVPAFSAADRAVLDLLAVRRDGRLVVLELKAEEDLHLALQALDYWVRVRWHNMQRDAISGQTELQRFGYFPGNTLQADAPLLYLVAPSLRIHPATEVVLQYVAPEVEWTLVALDERWREQLRVVYRKRRELHP
ncbi:MAG: hypothetical protein ACP5EP_11585 [Acidobacteriaceae bacterium]